MGESTEQKIMKLFKQFKLGNSLQTVKYLIDKELVKEAKLSDSEVDKIVRKQLVHVLADGIMNSHSGSIESKPVDGDETSIEYGLQLMAFRLDDFKAIIEATIQMLSEEQIITIRNGETEAAC